MIELTRQVGDELMVHIGVQESDGEALCSLRIGGAELVIDTKSDRLIGLLLPQRANSEIRVTDERQIFTPAGVAEAPKAPGGRARR